MLRLHWRRPAIRGKIQSRRFSVAHKDQRDCIGIRSTMLIPTGNAALETATSAERGHKVR
jgi:hypothetical protein